MDLLYILRHFPKISERFILDEIIHLLRSGVRIHIFSLENPRESYIHKEVFETGIMEKVTYFTQRSTGEQLKTIISNLDLLKSLTIYDKSKTDHFSKAIFFKRCLKTLKQKPDLIHAHFADDAATLAMYLSTSTKIPFTFTAHAYGIFEQSRIEPVLFKEKLRRATRIVAISNYNKIFLQNYCKKRNEIQVIHCGVNLA